MIFILNGKVIIMLYSYIIDNNEMYPEDWNDFEIFSTEEVSFEEFKSLVEKAFKLSAPFNNYASVARKIIEIDERFFLPQRKAVAFIGMERDDYKDKIRGFREINE